MSAHTPGPWKVTDARTEDDGETYGALIVQTADATIASNIYHEADARLIASAPDLLYALKRVVERPGPLFHLVLDEHEKHWPQIAAARAAIAKATGGEA